MIDANKDKQDERAHKGAEKYELWFGDDTKADEAFKAIEIVEGLKELIEEKEGWLRVNTYRISEHQKQIVENEIKELREIIRGRND